MKKSGIMKVYSKNHSKKENPFVRLKMGSVVLEMNTNCSEHKSLIKKMSVKHKDFVSNDLPDLVFEINNLKINNQFASAKNNKNFFYDENQNFFFIRIDFLEAKYFIEKNKVYVNLPINKSFAVKHRFVIIAIKHVLDLYLASTNKGLLLHSAGFVKGDSYSVLFAGSSGSGKTFLSKYFSNHLINSLNKQESLKFMNDETILIQLKQGTLYAFSTILSGKEETKPNNYGAPLKKIFFLRKTTRNKISIIKGIDLFQALLGTSFLISLILHGKGFNKSQKIVKNCFSVISLITSSIKCFILERNKDTKEFYESLLLELDA